MNYVKIDNVEINRIVNSLINQEVNRYKKIGNQTHKELRERATIKWFNDLLFPESRYTMMKALRYKSNTKINNNLIELEFISYIDSSKYDIANTSMYRQKNKYPIDHFSYIVEDLQWEHGILGLPEKSSKTDWVNKYFHKGNSLEDITEKVFKDNWKRRLNQYCKKEFGEKKFK